VAIGSGGRGRGLSSVRLLVATGNPGKLREIQALLTGLPLEVASLADVATVEFPPEGAEYAQNAIVKARVAAGQLGQWALADDSGLEVDGLDGAPGAFSARYGGERLDDADRAAHLIAQLGARPGAQRSARFVCVVALVSASGEVHTARGECPGTILPAPRGAGGFGYDPIFRPDGFEFSLAELPPGVKDRISHRGLALAQLRPLLEAISTRSRAGAELG